MSDKIFMYGDLETVDILNKNIPKVILFGGYLGYNNFGDILQLKGAIKYHTNISMLEPVIVCQVGSIPDRDFLTRLRKWFGVRAFIFVQDQPVELALLNMHLIDQFLTIENLHVYGGGFLNRMWGDYCLKLIEGLIENFRASNYIVSGQQIDAELANRLKTHFEKYRPKLIGARDFISQKIINSIGFKCEFSFDDASNIIEAWARRKPENSREKEGLFIHLNTSKYTWNNSEDYRKEHNRITQILKKSAERFGSFEPVFLSAYSEYRIEVKDTMATIISMEDALPFLDYRVMDIAHMALLHNPFNTDIDSNLAMLREGVGISSSYHTSIFCNMLGIPCYLLSENIYYNQKKEGLGEKRTLDQFLDNPSILSYSDVMERREHWLKKMSSAFEYVDRTTNRSTISLNYKECDAAPASLCFKEANVYENENCRFRKELIELNAALEEKSRLIMQLEKNFDGAKDEIKALRSSLSWRVTSPLRQIFGLLKRR